MAGAALTAILDYLVRSRDTVQAAIDDPTFVAAIGDIVEVTASAIGNGRKLLLAGNGGSAADAQHLAGEIVSRMNYDRAPAAALALTTDTSIFIAISTSGRSPNILRAIDAARERRIVTIGFTGRTGGEMPSRCDLCLRAPSDSTPLIQQIHITAGHIICGLVEERLFSRG